MTFLCCRNEWKVTYCWHFLWNYFSRSDSASEVTKFIIECKKISLKGKWAKYCVHLKNIFLYCTYTFLCIHLFFKNTFVYVSMSIRLYIYMIQANCRFFLKKIHNNKNNTRYKHASNVAPYLTLWLLNLLF